MEKVELKILILIRTTDIERLSKNHKNIDKETYTPYAFWKRIGKALWWNRYIESWRFQNRIDNLQLVQGFSMFSIFPTQIQFFILTFFLLPRW